MSKIADELNAEMMKACAATNPQELERQIMSSIVPKNEREHWAAREIKHLRNRLENERATVEAFQKVIQQADEDIGVLRRQRDYEYVRAENAEQERDQLREQLEQTRTNDRIAMQYLADIKTALGHDGDYPSLIALAENLREQLDEREKQVTILRGYCEAQLRKDKVASYERCLDCDYEQKCSLETGCLGVKDNSPIMNKALASRDAEIESLRQQLSEAQSDRDAIKKEWEKAYEIGMLAKQQLAALKSELKTIGEAINDPRTDLTMTMSEVIIEFKQQLAAALAACKAKDELIRMCAGIQVGYLKDALAIQPDDSALKDKAMTTYEQPKDWIERHLVEDPGGLLACEPSRLDTLNEELRLARQTNEAQHQQLAAALDEARMANVSADEVRSTYAEEMRKLSKQLADSQKREVMLRLALETCQVGDFSTGHVIYPSFDEKLVNEALAATADIDGLILCKKKPTAWCRDVIYEMPPEFAFSWLNTQLHYLPLYRAWEPTK